MNCAKDIHVAKALIHQRDPNDILSSSLLITLKQAAQSYQIPSYN